MSERTAVEERATRLAVLKQAVAGCTACNLRPGPMVPVIPVFGRGDPAARLMIVGEAPGPEENKAGATFIGPSGKVLSGLLAQAGIDEAKVWITNAVACWPHQPSPHRQTSKPATCSPTQVQIHWCVRRHLAEQVKAIRPRVIVALGASATCGVKMSSAATLNGRLGPALAFTATDTDRTTLVHETDMGGLLDYKVTVLVTYHPAFLTRRGFLPGAPGEAHPDARLVLRTLQAARELTMSEAIAPPPRGDK